MNNAKVQEGNDPAERPADILEEAERTLVQFVELVTKINVSNTLITLDNGKTLTAALAERDALHIKWRICR